MAPKTLNEHDDDIPRGRILTRREVLSLLAGLGGAAMLAACNPSGSNIGTLQAQSDTTPVPTGTLPAESGTVLAGTPVQASPTADTAVVPDCVVKPELTEGPYFKDEKINRSDVRSDTSTGAIKPGTPLVLAFALSKVANGTCSPLQGAQIDIWHCDAAGTYSDTSDPNWTSTVGQNYLRGYQLTDAKGAASFTTIYPGWYNGRAVHLHFKVRTTGIDGNSYEFTSQFFFDENITDQVHAKQPYAAKGQRTLRNANDGIYQGGGSQLLLTPVTSGTGYATTFAMGLDLSDTKVGASDSNAGGGGGPSGTPGAGGPPNGTPGAGGPPDGTRGPRPAGTTVPAPANTATTVVVQPEATVVSGTALPGMPSTGRPDK